jgi:hypothetical protein
LTSALVLFVELLFLRWVPASIVYFGFFTNVLLIGSFLGIGVGILLGRRFGDKRALLFGPVTLLAVAIVSLAQFNVVVRPTDELFFGLTEHAGDPNYVLVLPLVMLLVAATLAVSALPLGRQLRSLPPLGAYATDVAGAIFGIGLFSVCSLLQTPPSVWFAVAGALMLLTLAGPGERARISLFACLVAIVLVSGREPPGERWSPYYRIDVDPQPNGTYVLSVDGIPHQRLYVPAEAEGERFYSQIFRWLPDRRFQRELIVGAGGGTDVAAAIEHDVASIDAVEIDPAIVEVGRALHPQHPYDDPRVRVTINDGRNFLSRSTDRYDLIVFGLPDSLTLVSGTANLRLESYLFTEEAFAQVREHLTGDGVFVLYNYYREPWLVGKIATMLRTAFGADPIVRLYPGATAGAAALAIGPGISAARALPEGLGDGVDTLDTAVAGAPARDDWPFLYLRVPEIPAHYVLAVAALLLASIIAIGLSLRASGLRTRRLSPHFFALGAAFLLLETRSITTFGLLFGTTWYVNALVIAGILLSVLAAIAVTVALRPRSAVPLYLGLAVALAANLIMPPTTLLIEPASLRYALATALAFSPIFFANLVFTHSFRDAAEADLSFASNLLGAVVGGALEYLALAFGYAALIVVAAALYVIAFWLSAATRSSRVLERMPSRAAEYGE